MNKTAIIIGASGLVGSTLMQQLCEHPAYSKVIILVRKQLNIQHPKLEQRVIDFDQPAKSLIQGDEIYCALGTTLKKAGSKEAQYKIDCTYPAEFGKIARANGVKRYLLVSSTGANAQSGNFYLKTKGDLEEQLKAIGFDQLVIARPSFLLGDRSEFRLGEKIGIFVATLLKPLIPRRYRGITAEKVASALIKIGNEGRTGVIILENEEL